MPCNSTATPEVDYDSTNRSLVASPSSIPGSRSCFTFAIVNDSLVEEALEGFVLSVVLSDPASQIEVPSKQIQIKDDDSKQLVYVKVISNFTAFFFPMLSAAVLVGFESESVSALETSGEMVFTVSVLRGTLERPVEVNLVTANGTATGQSSICLHVM